MKKKIIFSAFAAASALLLVSSCTKEQQCENVSAADGKVFTASINQDLTRTTITSEFKVNWDEGDQIDINGAIFCATPDASDATKAIFTKVSGSDPAPDYTAVYPASIIADTAPTLPATQTYAAGKFNVPMCAMSDEETLEFKNFCGVLCFALKGTDKVRSIAVTANEQLCGPFEFMDATAFCFTGENEGYTVTLDCGTEGVQLNETTATNFYIYLPPCTYTPGMKMTVTNTDGQTFEKTTTKSAEIVRSNIYTFNWTPTMSAQTTDLSEIIGSALSGKSRGETAAVTLNSNTRYFLETTVDAGLINIVVNGNGAIVELGPEGQISGMQGIEINNVNFDCDKNTVAPIALSANPDESLKGATIQTEGTTLRNNAFYDLGTITLNKCNFSEVRTPLVSANMVGWNLYGLTIQNCIVQFDVASGIDSYIKWYGNSSNEGSIKNIVIENSTLYNIVESNDNYFLRYQNNSNAQPQKAWAEPQFNGLCSWTMTNNTIVNLPSNKNFANNYPNKSPICEFTWEGNIFYNTYRIQKAIQSNAANFTAADNSIKGITNEVDTTDKSKYATEDPTLAFSVPTAALDLTNLDLKANFTPTKGSYSYTNGFGDPRWKTTGITLNGR